MICNIDATFRRTLTRIRTPKNLHFPKKSLFKIRAPAVLLSCREYLLNCAWAPSRTRSLDSHPLLLEEFWSQDPTKRLGNITIPALSLLAKLFGIASGLPALLLISLVISTLGFVKSVYFVGYGYGLSMVSMGALALQHYAPTISQLALWHGCLVIAWGMRLFFFLFYREMVAWPELRARTRETNKKVGLCIFRAQCDSKSKN